MTAPGRDMGDAVAAWLTEYMAVPGETFRILRADDPVDRATCTNWGEWVREGELNTWHDGAHALVVNTSSVAKLCEVINAGRAAGAARGASLRLSSSLCGDAPAIRKKKPHIFPCLPSWLRLFSPLHT